MYKEPLANALDWLRGIPVYVWLVVVRWSTLIGGGVMSLSIYLWDRQHDSTHLFSLRNLVLIAIAAFFASGYDAWHAERRRVAGFGKELDRSRPRLNIRIDRLTVHAPHGNIVPRPWFVAKLCVTNEGHITTAREWHALITLGGKPEGVTKLTLGKYEFNEAAVWSNITNWSDPPQGDFERFDHTSDVEGAKNHEITRGPTPEWVFVGQLPYDGITLEDLKTITIQCEDFQKTTYFSVLPPGNIHLGFVRLR
jgi:hypothetical protein